MTKPPRCAGRGYGEACPDGTKDAVLIFETDRNDDGERGH